MSRALERSSAKQSSHKGPTESPEFGSLRGAVEVLKLRQSEHFGRFVYERRGPITSMTCDTPGVLVIM